MLTRQGFIHPSLAGVERVVTPGHIRVTTVKGINHTWAVARPSVGYSPNGNPHYLTERRDEPVMPVLPRTERAYTSLSLTAVNRAADLTDSTTWQRPYTFTQ